MNKKNIPDKVSVISKIPINLRSSIISVAWKAFHILLSWSDESLEKTSKWYLNKTNTSVDIDIESITSILDFKNLWKWIIISNHVSWVFSDYLPLFSILWDEILKKCIFYTWAYNLSMNKREFPEYEFRAATLKTRNDVFGLEKYLNEDIQKVNNEWWYIFIIPSWNSTSNWTDFKAIFQRLIKWSSDNLPILVNHVEHDWDIWYKEIATKLFTGLDWVTTRINSQISYAWEWKNLKWKEMREKYNLMKNKNRD